MAVQTEAFSLCHALADQFRSYLGLLKDSLSDAAPGWALVYRNWQAVFADNVWSLVRPELRLPYAIAQDFQPGLREPAEVKIRAEDKTFSARLKNFGVAVLGGAA